MSNASRKASPIPGMTRWLSVLLVAVAISPLHALEVTEGSDCAAICYDNTSGKVSDSGSSGTNTSEIVCEDGDFFSTGNGIRFRNCIDCLRDSKATADEESDVFWFLYNLRYAFDVCIYSYPDVNDSDAISSPCNIDGACESLKDALSTSLTDVDSSSQFAYCDASDSILSTHNYNDCTRCLETTSSQKYLTNFLVTLKAGCDQRPKAGDVLGISGEIFSSTLVNSTQSNNETLPGDGGATTGSMTTGTIVGIVVGCGLLFIGAVCLIFIYCRRQRRFRGQKIESPEPDGPSALGPITTSRKAPYAAVHEMSQPRSDSAMNTHGRTMSNAEYYDQLERTRQDAASRSANYRHATHTRIGSSGAALPAHPAYRPDVGGKGTASVRSPSPPNRATVLKSNAPDSYALRIYLQAGEDAGVDPARVPPNIEAHHARSSSTQGRHPSPPRPAAGAAAQASMPPPPPPPPPPPAPAPRKASGTRVPALVMPSLPKLKVPKKYAPPQVVVRGPTPPAGEEANDARISRPLAVLDTRFKDRPLGGGPVLATEIPATLSDSHYNRKQSHASPMMSGDSSRFFG